MIYSDEIEYLGRERKEQVKNDHGYFSSGKEVHFIIVDLLGNFQNSMMENRLKQGPVIFLNMANRNYKKK